MFRRAESRRGGGGGAERIPTSWGSADRSAPLDTAGTCFDPLHVMHDIQDSRMELGARIQKNTNPKINITDPPCFSSHVCVELLCCIRIMTPCDAVNFWMQSSQDRKQN